MSLISINGQSMERVSCSDRGFAYGDGLFETCRVVGKDIPLWDLHRSRLLTSLDRLSMSIDLNRVERYWRELIEPLHSNSAAHVLKIIITRGEGGRGYGFSSELKPTVVCSLHDYPEVTPGPVVLNVCDWRLSCSRELAGLKHLNRLDSVLMRSECQGKGWDDALAANQLDLVIETSHSNIFFKVGGQWVTPDLSCSGVRGVMRSFVMNELAPVCGFSIAEVDLPIAELGEVQAAFCTNSLRGIVAVSELDGRELEKDDDIASLMVALSRSCFNS